VRTESLWQENACDVVCQRKETACARVHSAAAAATVIVAAHEAAVRVLPCGGALEAPSIAPAVDAPALVAEEGFAVGVDAAD